MAWRASIAVGVMLAVVAVVVGAPDGPEQWSGGLPEAERPMSIAQVEADAIEAHADRVEAELTLHAEDAGADVVLSAFEGRVTHYGES